MGGIEQQFKNMQVIIEFLPVFKLFVPINVQFLPVYKLFVPINVQFFF